MGVLPALRKRYPMRTIDGSLEIAQTLLAKRNDGRLLSIATATVLTADSESRVHAVFSTAQDISLPTSGLYAGWATILTNSGTSAAVATVKVGGNTLHTLSPGRWCVVTSLSTTPSSLSDWSVVYSDGGSLGYVYPHDATTSWSGPTGGYYYLTVTALFHGQGLLPMVNCYETSGSICKEVIPDSVEINSSTGEVKVYVPDTPDLRYAGKITMKQVT
jgi:hypothetical protein